MSQPNFEVAHSRAVLEEFRQVLDHARDGGVLPIALRASRWIMEELALTPLEFGESREYLTHLDLFLRIGFAGPLYVEFAVNLPNRIVFIRRFGFSPSK
ncbi:hypothetical protein [Gemmata sp.]|uniref:hypothetical protein n=1 Tax=Gemmata sp. TaxID=1914242 RepID=UPI003F6EA963